MSEGGLHLTTTICQPHVHTSALFWTALHVTGPDTAILFSSLPETYPLLGLLGREVHIAYLYMSFILHVLNHLLHFGDLEGNLLP